MNENIIKGQFIVKKQKYEIPTISLNNPLNNPHNRTLEQVKEQFENQELYILELENQRLKNELRIEFLKKENREMKERLNRIKE